MTLIQTFEWVTLPAGLGQTPGGTARFSIFVAPQVTLEDEPKRRAALDELPELLDWPGAVGEMDFAIEVKIAGEAPTRIDAVRIGPEPRSAMWRRLFPGSTEIAPFVREDPTTFDIVSYHADAVLDLVEAGYAEAAPLDLVLEDQWQEDFWQPEEWMPELQVVPDDLSEIPDILNRWNVLTDGGRTGPRGPGLRGPGWWTREGEWIDWVDPVENITLKLAHAVIGNSPAWASDEVTSNLNAARRRMFAADGRQHLRYDINPDGMPDVFEVDWSPGTPLEYDPAIEVSRLMDTLSADPEAMQAYIVNDLNADGVVLTADAPVDSGAQAAAIRAQFDLHRTLSALGEHPALMRALGLVIDLEVPSESMLTHLGPAADHEFQVRVVPVRRTDRNGAATGRRDRTTWSAVTAAGPGGFGMAGSDGRAAGLEVMRGRYSVAQYDVEGVTTRLLGLARDEALHVARAARMARLAPADSGRTPPPAPDRGVGGRALPSLRTAGIRLIEIEAAERLRTRATAANGLRSGFNVDGDGVLHGDEVLRGYRLDVQDTTTGHWHSLHGRTVDYSTPDGALLSALDEGLFAESVRSAAVGHGSSLPPGATVVMSEAVVTWDGWSLATSLPGKAISSSLEDFDPESRAAAGREVANHVPNEPLTNSGLSIETAPAPGTLPKLRFGGQYRLRMRHVDLAGNSLTLSEADTALGVGGQEDLTSEAIVFRRFEPVPPPVLAWAPVAPATPGPGETTQRIVVRSFLDEGDSTFGAEPGRSVRWLFPPKAPMALVEWHGGFDEAIGADATADAREVAYRRAVEREAAELTPGTNRTPWLADPASAGVCLTGLPGQAEGDRLLIPWPQTPDGPGPIRLELEAEESDGLDPPWVRADQGWVEVYIPQGARVTAQVSSILATPEAMALPAIWRARLEGEALREADAKLAENRHPLITPASTIELVHATQRPVLAPAPAGEMLLDPRQSGETELRIQQDWNVHSATTGTVELFASWSVPLDEVETPARTGVAGPFGPTPSQPADWGPAETTTTQPVGAPTVVMPTWWGVGEDPVRTMRVIDSASSLLLPSPGDADEPSATPQWATVDLGSTKHALVKIRAIATSPFAEFFPPECGPSNAHDGGGPDQPSRLTRESESVLVRALSSRRPPAPVVDDVLPLQVRTLEEGHAFREGGWLRVWLARPWYVTGWEEHVAVIASTDRQPLDPAKPDEGYHASTLVAPDPARPNARPYPGLSKPAFGYDAASWVNVRLHEVRDADPGGDGLAFGSALTDRVVRWDPMREAWFFDFRIDEPSLYLPFVRLAIARHQTHTANLEPQVEDEVSPVVALDPIQVLPDRDLRWRSEATGIRVGLSGTTHAASLIPGLRAEGWAPRQGLPSSTATVVMQRRVRTHGDEALQWTTVFALPLAQDTTQPPGVLAVSAFLPFEPPTESEPNSILYEPGEFRLVVMETDWVGTSGYGRAGRITFVEQVPLDRAVYDPRRIFAAEVMIEEPTGPVDRPVDLDELTRLYLPVTIEPDPWIVRREQWRTHNEPFPFEIRGTP